MLSNTYLIVMAIEIFHLPVAVLRTVCLNFCVEFFNMFSNSSPLFFYQYIRHLNMQNKLRRRETDY